MIVALNHNDRGLIKGKSFWRCSKIFNFLETSIKQWYVFKHLNLFATIFGQLGYIETQIY